MHGCAHGYCDDPLRNAECIADGVTFQIQQTHWLNPCTRCQCVQKAGFAKWSNCQYKTCPRRLPCSTKQQVHGKEECCAKCKPEKLKPIQIQNCPKQVVLQDLEPHKQSVYYVPNIITVDNLGLDRLSKFELKPNRRRFYFEGVGEKYFQKLSIIATARNPDGDLDKDVCTYRINVRDPVLPHIVCPNNLLVYTPTDWRDVYWGPVLSSDNVGLKGEPVSNHAWGSNLTTGVHEISYSVQDLAGNTAQCSFTVEVQQIGNYFHF